MLIARAPMRISFGGGGTDLEAYYAKYGGLVISTAINKYFYAVITTDESDDLQVISADYRSLFRHSPGCRASSGSCSSSARSSSCSAW